MVNPSLARSTLHELRVKRPIVRTSRDSACQGANMPVQRKVFRIEQIGVATRPATLAAAKPNPGLPHGEILGELQAMRTLLERCGGSGSPADRDGGPVSDFEQFKSD